MYIVTVIPIKRGVQKEYLSYFASQNIELGTVVSVPMRSRNIDAIVVATVDAREHKSDLKSASFQLKKVIKIKGRAPFTEEFFKSCKLLKNYTVSGTGVIIETMLPKTFLENINDLKEIKDTDEIKLNDTKNYGGAKQEKLIYQALTQDRLSWYRTLIREAFAKKESVFICVPTRYDITEYSNALSKGIEQYVFSFYGDMNKKALINGYNKCIEEQHPILIIGTGMFLSIPRHDIKTIIVEKESSEAYKQIRRPYLDIRFFAEILSSIKKIKIIFGDTLLRPETFYRFETGELGEVAPPVFRLPETQQSLVIDMKEEQNESGLKSFLMLSNKTKTMVENAIENNESVFLFSVRKGLAGITVCNDCNYTLLCPRCSSPVVLYGAKQRTATKDSHNRVFMCNKCGLRQETETRCPICTSWNLTPLGIGTDRVYEEVQKLFPNARIVQIDKETTSTETEAKKAIELFYKYPGSILIGTEMAFSFMRLPIVHSAIISLDGLLSIPSFNMTQKIIHIIDKLSSITQKNFIIQTRIPDNKILTNVSRGTIISLLREDLDERKHFGYPPFKKLIKITFTGTARETEEVKLYLEKVLTDYSPEIFSAFIGKVKGEYVTNTVIKINPTLWPVPIAGNEGQDQKLYETLLSLPQSFSINVDPEDLL